MKSRLVANKFVIGGAFLVNFLYATISFAQAGTLPSRPSLSGETTGETAAVAAAESQAVATEQAPTTSDRFISDGSPVNIDSLGITVRPPQGWEVLTNAMGMSLILQEPKLEEEASKSNTANVEPKVTFQKNITFVVKNEPAAIDENEAKLFKEELQKEFGEKAGLKNFQILGDHKFFDYKGQKDGLIVYSHFLISDIPMMQMHIYVSGQANRVVMTYTDLASDFEKNEQAFQTAWAAMSTVEMTGIAPNRYENLIQYGIAAALAFCLLGAFLFFRRRREKAAFNADDVDFEALSSGEITSVSSLWSLDSEEKTQVENLGLEFSRTRPLAKSEDEFYSSVSNLY